MLVLRCTQTLRKRLKRDEEPGQSTTVLGDWYGGVIRLGRRQALLFVSERSRMPVLLPVHNAKRIDQALPEQVRRLLTLILFSEEDQISRECAAMSPMAVSRTANCQVVETMTNYAATARQLLQRSRSQDLFGLSLDLANAPIVPLGGKDARALTCEAFGVLVPPKLSPEWLKCVCPCRASGQARMS